MASTVETAKAEKPDIDWTIVQPRRGKRRSNLPKITTPEEQQQPWAPTDLETNPERESKLMQKMQNCIKKIESSNFYLTFINQIQTPQTIDYFYRVLGSKIKMQMTIYGIGSIESYEPPRFQLSLAILTKRKFNWIGDIEVFDPVLSATEIKVLEALGCSVLSINEHGRRLVLEPTIFFMPHCEAFLYDNLLQVNWKAELLNQMVVFGNSFKRYRCYASEFKDSVVHSSKHVLGVQQFTNEIKIEVVSDDFYRAFHDSSWHFFKVDPEEELLIIH